MLTARPPWDVSLYFESMSAPVSRIGLITLSRLTWCSPPPNRAIRSELRSASPGLTVTEVATRHGFVELGRFAAQYRAAFGENPSTTLRRSLKKRRRRGRAERKQ